MGSAVQVLPKIDSGAATRWRNCVHVNVNQINIQSAKLSLFKRYKKFKNVSIDFGFRKTLG
jgi:hypothetical protein